MAQEDEMSLPYLVFRTWRNYYDELLKADISIKNEEYESGRTQLHHAGESLLESKERLLSRGLTPDDDRISDVSAILLKADHRRRAAHPPAGGRIGVQGGPFHRRAAAGGRTEAYL